MTISSPRQLWPIAAAPAVFFILCTAQQVAVGDPEAFENPLLYLLVAYLFYGPVFAGTGGACLALFSGVQRSPAWWSFVVSGVFGMLVASVLFAIAHRVLHLPSMAYPFVAIVGLWEGVVWRREWLPRVKQHADGP